MPILEKGILMKSFLLPEATSSFGCFGTSDIWITAWPVGSKVQSYSDWSHHFLCIHMKCFWFLFRRTNYMQLFWLALFMCPDREYLCPSSKLGAGRTPSKYWMLPSLYPYKNNLSLSDCLIFVLAYHVPTYEPLIVSRAAVQALMNWPDSSLDNYFLFTCMFCTGLIGDHLVCYLSWANLSFNADVPCCKAAAFQQ